MNPWDGAEEYLVERFRREGVIEGTPGRIAREGGFPLHVMEQALADLVRQNRVHSFQTDDGRLEWEWKLP
ncbi:MAG: hypothetical protein HY321_10975 [Armatimonadetes bacterium]|nr:hypothetical protein [Armatimonadota bacterium]